MMMTSSRYPIRHFKTAREWHTYFVYNDPEFIASFRLIQQAKDLPLKTTEAMYEMLAMEYSIRMGDIRLFDLNSTIYITNKDTGATLRHSDEHAKFSIEFSATTPYAEILDQLDAFEKMRKALFPLPTTRRRSPSNPALVYAIFKERSRGKTFTNIFANYSEEELPGYRGKYGVYESREDLQKYYDNNKPIRKLKNP